MLGSPANWRALLIGLSNMVVHRLHLRRRMPISSSSRFCLSADAAEPMTALAGSPSFFPRAMVERPASASCMLCWYGCDMYSLIREYSGWVVSCRLCVPWAAWSTVVRAQLMTTAVTVLGS
jgi:hypothetical protein